MPRAYNTSAVAAALGATEKWLDNILTHHDVRGVYSAGQGIPRRMSPDSVVTVHVAKVLMDQMGTPAAAALQAGHQLVATGRVDFEPGLNLAMDRAVVESSLNLKLLHAVQASPPKRRGRPPTLKPDTRKSGY
jgi:hypothetical protein